MSKSFTILDPQQKGKPFAAALIAAGWTAHDVNQWHPADVLLTHHDMPISNYRYAIDRYAELGAKIVVFPDGFNPFTYWDGIHLPYKNDAALIISEAHRAVMDTWRHPVPTHVIGWPWSPVCDFQPTSGARVLFAPVHPDGNGYLPPADVQTNRLVYAALLELPGIELKVRYLGSLDQNGLQAENGVIFEAGVYDNSHQSIHAADVVIATGTYAAMAVALGKPVVMYSQNMPQTPHYDDYIGMLDYPFTWEKGIDMGNLIKIVCSGMQAADDWKARFISHEMQPAALVEIIEGICNG